MKPSEAVSTGPLWIYPKVQPSWGDDIIKEFRINPITAQVLVSRGFRSLDDINSYLYSKLPELHDPQLFPDMDKAIERIMRAIKEKENILIYGDNDVDGMTGTALLTEFLQLIGGNVFFYVPNRTNLRENLILDALSYAKEENCKLLITVDCGITATEGINQIIGSTVDVIITDHHEPTNKFPHCVATLNPKLLTTNYPNRDLTGVGVAFKLAHAITNYLSNIDSPLAKKIDLKDYLDLVALGTISDMGALLEENRILVRYGLMQLNKTKRVGIIKLCSVCEIDIASVGVSEVASKIAPRLNSLGRIADPRKGVEMLTVLDPERAEALAIDLDLNNIERQKIERLVSADVDAFLLENPITLQNKAIILSSEKWHPGVIPIVCTRISKTFNRPTVIIAIDNKIGKGSIRSIKEFPLLPVLKETSDILIDFGGHDFAAGLTIAEEHIEQFRNHFINTANNQLKENDILSKLTIDAKADFDQIDFEFMESLNLLEPFGNENPYPILYSDVTQPWPPKIIGTNHLKLYVEQNDRMLEGIAFGMADRRKELKKKNLNLRIAFTPQINTFQNKISIQLLIRDFQIL